MLYETFFQFFEFGGHINYMLIYLNERKYIGIRKICQFARKERKSHEILMV